MTEPDTFAARLQQLRERSGLSLRQLAKLAGVSPGYPWHVESGRVDQVGTDVAVRFARALGSSLEYLLAGVGEPPTDEQIASAVSEATARLQPADPAPSDDPDTDPGLEPPPASSPSGEAERKAAG